MIDRLTVVDSCLHVHQGDISLKTTKAFTHGAVIFDTNTRLVTFGKLPPVQLPAELVLENGSTLELKLVAPDGRLRKQTRSGVLRVNPKEPSVVRIAGISKTPSKFSAEDGWQIEVFRYRAYFSHPGLNTNSGLPDWLKASIDRQRSLWNRMSWLCREARRKCSPVPTEEIVTFVAGTILPAIDALNASLGNSKLKMKHPVKLKTEMPGVDGLWNFVGELRTRTEKGRPVPDGLLETVVAFAEQFKSDYTPINDFLRRYREIAKNEADSLGLLHYEFRPVLQRFESLLRARRTRKLPWSEGWPRIKFGDKPGDNGWSLTYYFNKAGVDSAGLDTPAGVPGLTFGAPKKASSTGHELMTGIAANRMLREAEISIPGSNHEQWNFRFGVLQHRPLPANSHIKQWQILCSEGALWLCLTVERQRSVPVPGEVSAGLDIGWKRTEEGLRFGTLYEPATKTFYELVIDMQKSPEDPKDRKPFRIALGTTRWVKRNITKLLPDWKPGDSVPGTFELRSALQTRRSQSKDKAKALLRRHLEDRVPAWFDTAGKNGLLHLADQHKEDTVVQDIVRNFQVEDRALGDLFSLSVKRSTNRLAYGYEQVAHDVCRHLKQKGILRLVVETSFLAKVAQQQDNEDPVALKRSHAYRHFAGVGKFVMTLKNTAKKYGIVVSDVSAVNTTRICQFCNHLNTATAKERFQCEQCGQMLQQDQNAAVNLVRFSHNPALVEMVPLKRT